MRAGVIFVALLCATTSAIVKSRHGPSHAKSRNSFTKIGLTPKASFLDVISAMETARMFDTRTMDLEQVITNYEMSLHDAYFDHLTCQEVNLDFRDPQRQNRPEKLLTRIQFLEGDFYCMPPLRVVSYKLKNMLPSNFSVRQFAEGLQQFDIYSEGRDVIGSADLARAYQRSFKMNISSPHASALIRGLKYNSKADDSLYVTRSAVIEYEGGLSVVKP